MIQIEEAVPQLSGNTHFVPMLFRIDSGGSLHEVVFRRDSQLRGSLDEELGVCLFHVATACRAPILA
jgi:hypothetical protein